MVSDTLRIWTAIIWGAVLILVLMEYGLWRRTLRHSFSRLSVLILVLMEYGLWPIAAKVIAKSSVSLNPCSNGIWSLTFFFGSDCSREEFCLNPCSNGIWSLTVLSWHYWKWRIGRHPRCTAIGSLTRLWLPYQRYPAVLILVLMEYGLWPSGVTPCASTSTVLILVLMEYGLWQQYQKLLLQSDQRS